MPKELPLIPEGVDDTPYNLNVWEAQIQAADPPYEDEITGNLLEASLKASKTIPPYSKLWDEYYHNSGNVLPAYAVRKWTKAHIVLLASQPLRRVVNFPDDFRDIEHIHRVNEHLFRDPQSPFLKKLSEELDRPLQTSRPVRKLIYAYLAGLVNMRGTAPVIIHDNGAANGIILNSLAAVDINNDLTEVMGKDRQIDPAKTALFRDFSNNAQIEGGFWIDLMPPETPEDEERIKNCSIEPQDFRRNDGSGGKWEDYYDNAAACHTRKVLGIKGNFSRLKSSDERFLQTIKADLTIFSHSLAEKPQTAKRSIRKAIERTNPGGLVAVTGRVEHDPTHQELIPIPAGWYRKPWITRTYVLDTANLDQGWVLLIKSQDGTGLTVWLNNEEKIIGEKLF